MKPDGTSDSHGMKRKIQDMNDNEPMTFGSDAHIRWLMQALDVELDVAKKFAEELKEKKTMHKQSCDTVCPECKSPWPLARLQKSRRGPPTSTHKVTYCHNRKGHDCRYCPPLDADAAS